MLEREWVVQTIDLLVDGARQGRGGALFVAGHAGLGKTTVLDFACKRAASSARVGVARGDPMETAVAFGLATQAVEDVGGATLLRQDVLNPFPDDIRAAKFHQTIEWLGTVAADGPVLLAFDDVHWADADSLALLSYLCRRITSMPVAVVATLRPWPPAAEAMCLRLVEAGQASIERLQPLSTEAAGTLVGAHLGRQLPADVLAAVCEASARNPLLLELAALALGTGSHSADRAEVSDAAPDRRIRALVLHRFADLPEEGLALARAASVLGRRFRTDVATTLAGLDDAQSDLALDALSRTGLVRAAGFGFAEFTYPLFSQAMYEELSSLVRDQLHGRSFRLLVDRGLPEEAAEHAVRGNLVGDVLAIECLTSAGRAALRAGAVATAVVRLERAVALAGEQPSPALLLLLGEALMAEGAADRAIAVYERVLRDAALPTAPAAEAQRMLGRALFLTGEVERGTRTLESAAERSGEDGPERTVRALLDLSRAAWMTAGPAGALRAASQARAKAHRADERLRLEVEAAWGFVALVGGDPAGLAATMEAGRVEARDEATSVLRDLAWSWGTLRNTARAAKYVERFDEAEGIFRAMFVQAEKIGSPHAITSLAAHHADTLARRGRLEQSRPLVSKAVALADLAPMAAAFAHSVDAALLFHASRLEDTEEACQRAEQAAKAVGQWLPQMRVCHLRAQALADAGRLDEASAKYAELEAETARLGIGEPCLVPWARHGIATFAAAGYYADAARVQAWVEGCARRLPCTWPRIAAESGRAVLAQSRDDGAAAEASLRAALALESHADLEPEHVETLLQWGSFLRRTGRVVEARRVLRQAHSRAERTGSLRLAHQVSGELAVAGGRRRPSYAPDQLTPQEQRVAELATAGHSSRDIASRLSLSTRTIETHLHRVYRKLGVHSQRELMARSNTVAPGSSPPGPPRRT